MLFYCFISENLMPCLSKSEHEAGFEGVDCAELLTADAEQAHVVVIAEKGPVGALHQCAAYCPTER